MRTRRTVLVPADIVALAPLTACIARGVQAAETVVVTRAAEATASVSSPTSATASSSSSSSSTAGPTVAVNHTGGDRGAVEVIEAPRAEARH